MFQFKKGKYSNSKKKNIPIRKRKIFQLEKGKYSNQKKENSPMRKSRTFQLEKGNNSNQKKENIPIRKNVYEAVVSQSKNCKIMLTTSSIASILSSRQSYGRSWTTMSTLFT